MSKNKSLWDAKERKADEFYTQYEDVVKGLQPFANTNQFAGKTVYSFTDSPESAFTKYFVKNFENLGLKKFIHTWGYLDNKGYTRTYSNPNNHITYEEGNGDFSNPAYNKWWDKADLVVTNPPFSKHRDVFSKIFENQKQFILLGSMLWSQYVYLKDYILNGSMNVVSVYDKPEIAKFFVVPNHYENISKHEMSVKQLDDGTQMMRSNCYWFTSMKLENNKPIIPLCDVIPKRSTNMWAINMRVEPNQPIYNIGKVKHIPDNYYHPIAVPISYLSVHNPKYFDLLAIKYNLKGRDLMFVDFNGKQKKLFTRVIICRKQILGTD